MADPQFEPTRKRKLVGHLIGIPLADKSILELRLLPKECHLRLLPIERGPS